MPKKSTVIICSSNLETKNTFGADLTAAIKQTTNRRVICADAGKSNLRFFINRQKKKSEITLIDLGNLSKNFKLAKSLSKIADIRFLHLFHYFSPEQLKSKCDELNSQIKKIPKLEIVAARPADLLKKNPSFQLLLGSGRSMRSLARMVSGCGVALALGGGGCRAYSSIGVLKVLEKAGIEIDFLVGTSAGGIVSAFYGYGNSPKQLESVLNEKSLKAKYILSLESGALFDVYLCPDVSKYGIWENDKKIKEIVRKGYITAKEGLPLIKKKMKQKRIKLLKNFA